ncbi:MAG: helix-turn-helix domain-containing protein, partial [Acutalibacteraceae bacterium]
TQILIACYREHTDRFTEAYQPVNPAIYEIRAYLERHFTEPVSMTELAERYFLNPCYVSHSFAQAVGCSPKRYVMLNRIAKAKELLLHSDLAIQQISAQCGFADCNNFIRTFKKETGIPPRQYRAMAEERHMI